MKLIIINSKIEIEIKYNFMIPLKKFVDNESSA